MRFFDRLKKGWELAQISFTTINEERALLVFPIFSTLALFTILITFFGGGYFLMGDQIETLLDEESAAGNMLAYGLIFLYYLVNFFIVVFFNSALIYCAMKHFEGEPTTFSEGLNFASSRIGKILSWAVVSATVGTLLQALQNTGKLGEFVGALFGSAWSILTFFVVPILIFEDRNVFDTIKESGKIMKDKWGESLVANVSFGLFHFLGILLAILIGFLLSSIHVLLGIAVGISVILLISTVIAAARTVFVAAVYNHVGGRPTGHFSSDVLDDVFITK